EVPYDDAVDPADVERFLDSHPEIELVAVVHSETPSGTLTDLAAIGPVARARSDHARRLRLLARRHALPDGRVAARRVRRRPPEVPRRTARDVADDGE